MTKVTVSKAANPYLRVDGAHTAAPLEDTTMFWKNFFGFASDCLAIVLGCLIATPFFLVLAAPFLGGF